MVNQVNVCLLYEDAVDSAPEDQLKTEDITNIDGPVRRGKEIIMEMIQLLGTTDTNSKFVEELRKIQVEHRVEPFHDSGKSQCQIGICS